MILLSDVPPPTLAAIASALESGKLTSALEARVLQSIVGTDSLPELREQLQQLFGAGFTPGQAASVLRMLQVERQTQQQALDRVDWVWSGSPEFVGSNRDTAVVVQELFRQAKRSVLIVTFAMDSGDRARTIFGSLAARMENETDLDVTLCLNIHPALESGREASKRAFALNFKTSVWPGTRLPKVYFDPRALNLSGKERASLHAKCIVIDEQTAFITSANFTEAAQARNIEVGALVRDDKIASELSLRFRRLISTGAFESLPFAR